MKAVNLTPHDITIMTDEGSVMNIPPSGTIARITLIKTDCATVEIGDTIIPVVRNQANGKITGLPKQLQGTVYIVSRAVAEMAGNRRDDLYFPDSSIRDDSGNIVACRCLCQV